MLNLKDPSLLKQQCYINGQWLDADNGETIPVTNPATGEVIATVPKMGKAEAERAVAGAAEAFKSWKKKSRMVIHTCLLMKQSVRLIPRW